MESPPPPMDKNHVNDVIEEIAGGRAEFQPMDVDVPTDLTAGLTADLTAELSSALGDTDHPSFNSTFLPVGAENRAGTVSPQSLSLNPVPSFTDSVHELKEEDPTLIPFEDSSFQAYNLKRKRSSTVTVTLPKVSTVVPQLTHVPLKTGICYDVRMRYHSRIVTNCYDYVDPHPEDPRRIYRIYKAIAEAGLITDPDLKGATELGPLMQKIHIREATDQEILSVHTQEHLDFIESTTRMSRDQLIEETDKGDSIYLSNDSYLSAKLSCGGAIEACRSVVERKVKNCIAVVRPPGHHAEPQAPGGFCLFSNVAVAAKAMLKNYPETVRRILVLDWDVHHGNGTQKAFFDDDRVLYISLHRHENGRFYPGTTFGGHTIIGEGAGRGFNVNIPWSHAGMGDGDYMYAFNKVVMPMAVEYDPDLVIISAGFDAAEGDLIGGCLVSPNGYGYMTHMMKSLANGQLVVVLEGGYNLDAISTSALAVTKVLLGDPAGFPKTKLPSREAIKVVDEVVKVQSPFWKCLRPEIGVVKLDEADRHERLGAFQAKALGTRYGFCTLPVLGDNAALAVESQILASPGIHSKAKVMVIVHDSSEVWADKDPISGKINPSKSLVVSSTEKFINYAMTHDFGVVDVSIPEDHNVFGDSFSALACSQDACVYLWDNYFDYFDAKNIIFIGIGESYGGIVHLAGHREIRNRTDAILCFIGNVSLKPIVPVIDEYVTDWFYKSSLVFTSSEHVAWDVGINPKRPRKKFGRVLKADSSSLYDIAEERFREAVEFVEDVLEGEE